MVQQKNLVGFGQLLGGYSVGRVRDYSGKAGTIMLAGGRDLLHGVVANSFGVELAL